MPSRPTCHRSLVGAAIRLWVQLFGMISFELFGHLVGSVDPAEEFFEHEIAAVVGRLGLLPAR